MLPAAEPIRLADDARAFARRLDAGVLVGRRDLDGRRRRRAWPGRSLGNPSRDASAQFSPDGKEIAFVSRIATGQRPGVRDARRRLGFAQADHFPHGGIRCSRGIFPTVKRCSSAALATITGTSRRAVLQGRLATSERPRSCSSTITDDDGSTLARWQVAPLHARRHPLVAQGISRVAGCASLAVRPGGARPSRSCSIPKAAPCWPLWKPDGKGFYYVGRERRLVQPPRIRDRGARRARR